MGCNCGKNKQAMTAAAINAERERLDFEARVAAETAKASDEANAAHSPAR